MAIIYELSKHAYFLYARPTVSRCMEELGRSALNNPHFWNNCKTLCN